MSHLDLLQAIQEHMRFARARFGKYGTIDFVVLIGYALSGERTLQAFTSDSHRSRTLSWPSLVVMISRIVRPSRGFRWPWIKGAWKELRTLFLADLVARTRLSLLLVAWWTAEETSGGWWMSMPPNKPPVNVRSRTSGAFLPLIVG
jgi:hypothetical protein